MSDDERIHLSSLATAPVPDVVGPALRRFRRRVAMRAALVALVTVSLVLGAVALWPRERADIRALDASTGYQPPGGWGNDDVLEVYARGRVPSDATSWRAYTWPVPRHGFVCWSLVPERPTHAVVNCLDPPRVGTILQRPRGFPGTVALEDFDQVQPPSEFSTLAVSGVTLPEVAVIRVKVHYDDNVVEHRTEAVLPARGGPLRFFALVLPGEIRSLERVSVEGLDAAGNVVTRNDTEDVRGMDSTPDEKRRAASIAVAAGGDPAAKAVAVWDPEPYETTLKSLSNILTPTVDGRTLVYRVDLEGGFPSSDQLLSGPVGVRYVLVAQDSEEVLVVADPPPNRRT